MVLGAITHEAPSLRLDARFVEVKSGAVLLSTSVTEKRDDLGAALSALTAEVARQFNQPISEETRARLAAQRPSKAEFEAHARQQLASEALGRGVGRDTPPPGPPIPWLGISLAAVGVAGSATAFSLATQHSGYASYYSALSSI